ncbi:uncharacterized protein K02A2.6-like [Saccostrea echinata]|uniref:uncharacterized protein K02A2.6-like n=1 Tax=Saccostrea echinata TaxID=191078 RepID=UPI002A7F5CD2|nr:uncharacterized protein K02A2.6-like [Saccostrea echinata]
MDKLNPPPILSLEGNLKENWRKFEQLFQIYLTASGMDDKEDKLKTNILLHLIGPDAVEIYNTFEFEDARNKLKLKPVLDKFKEYCNPRKNIIFERHIFNSRSQGPAEPIDSYVTNLKNKAKSCEFGEIKDSLIRERIVQGIRSDSVRSRLLRTPELTLEKSVEICRATEATENQMKLMTESGASTEGVDLIKKQKSKREMQKEIKSKCGKCGKSHEPRNCPAFGKQCYKCQKKNHFSKMCRNTMHRKPHEFKKRSVNMVNNQDSDSEYSVDTVAMENSKREWTAHLKIGNKSLRMKMDTEAQVNVMSKKTFDSISSGKINLTKSKAKLLSYSGHKIKPCGKAVLTGAYKGKFYNLDFHVVNDDVSTVLGLNSCVEMNLIARVNTASNKDAVLDEFKDVFEGIGKIKGKYTIKVDKSVSPVVHAPRKVPFTIKRKVKTELDRMEKQKIIEKIQQPTEWVNSMVVVEKPYKVRICLDPRDLNKAVRREHFPMKTVEEVASKVAGASVFSTLDASSGFWHIQLDEESSKLTTFNTPFGRYKYLRMPMGINSAPEIFQRTVSQLFEDIDGCEIIMDDILV